MIRVLTSPLLLCSLLGAAAAQEAEKRTSPFTAVKWEGDKPIVQFEGEWCGFVSIDGLSRDKLVAFLKKEYDDDWKKRFGEDLVEALEEMGLKPQVKVKLELEKGGKSVSVAGTFTKDNRRSVWKYNREHPEGIEVESTRRERRPRRSREPRSMYAFESAKIVYKYTGDLEGTETYWVADNGKTLVLQRDKKVGILDQKTTFYRDGKATTWDPKKKSAFTMRLLPRDMKLSVLHARDSTLERIGLIRKGTETIAGKECVLYEKKDGDKIWRSWRWKGIELKIEFKKYLNTSYEKVAVSVEEGIKIPEELFKIPEGYTHK